MEVIAYESHLRAETIVFGLFSAFVVAAYAVAGLRSLWRRIRDH